jgi:hypothetical protein
MNKIQKVSRFFRYLFLLLFFLLVLYFVSSWVIFPENLGGMQFIPHNLPILFPISTTTKGFAIALSLIPLAIELGVLYLLIRLFGFFEKSEVFSIAAVTAIKRIGYVLFIGQVIHPFYEAAISAALTWNNGPHHRMTEITFTQANAGLLLMGLMMILISWIMLEGYKLKQDQQFTI